jgi:outer membrane lipoprotein-sorting protein
MKKLFFILSILAFAATISFAQTTATAIKTTYKGKKSTTTNGILYAKKASKVAIITGKDALIMNGTAFTMKKGPLKAKTDATKDMQYRTFHDVLNNILLGGNTDVSKYSDTKITKSNGNTVYTITPSAGNKKLMFTSFVITASGKELKSIRLNRSNGQYTEYVFSDYKTGVTIDDKVFK